MEFIRDRQNWSLILAGLFFLGVGAFALYLYGVSQSDLLHHKSGHIPAVLFAGLTFIFLSGSLAIWLAFHNRKVLLAGSEKKDNDVSSNKRGWTNGDKVPTPTLKAQQTDTSDDKGSTGMRGVQHHDITQLDEGGILESVLMVSNDMAERKRIALEIHLQNKKITESIQYAKRIQSAILPNMKLIHRALPDSFILYKPRDVVSGDFP